jgi:hypothetical protein
VVSAYATRHERMPLPAFPVVDKVAVEHEGADR